LLLVLSPICLLSTSWNRWEN